MVEKDDRREESKEHRAAEERWRREEAVLRQAAAELAHRRAEAEATALAALDGINGEDSFHLITKSLDDPSPKVRNAAVRALYDLNPDLAASFFNRALREGSPDERRKIGAALAGSGLASNAIEDLTGASRENSYSAFSLLFLVAKAGEVQPLMRVIESHPSIELRLAVIKLLALSGDPEVVPSFRRLAARSSFPPEVRAEIMEAIYQIGGKSR